MRQQDGFFRHGVAHLRPLNLKTVADEIGMHESTVSRVTSNKAIGTSRGTFEMKYFFTAAIAGAAGAEAHSSEAVRHRIRQLIDAEAADDVLSDDALVQKLKEEGIEQLAVGETDPLHLDHVGRARRRPRRRRRAADVLRRLLLAGDGAGDLRPRGRDQLRAHGPRRPGVPLGAARRRRRRDHDRGRASTTISERDGRGFYVFETVSTNERGETVCVGTWTNIVRGV